jgi:hypothetical protein
MKPFTLDSGRRAMADCSSAIATVYLALGGPLEWCTSAALAERARGGSRRWSRGHGLAGTTAVNGRRPRACANTPGAGPSLRTLVGGEARAGDGAVAVGREPWRIESPSRRCEPSYTPSPTRAPAPSRRGAAREFMGARALFINGRAASTWPRLVTAARALLKACR